MKISRELAIVKSRLEKERAKLSRYRNQATLKDLHNAERVIFLARILLLEELIEDFLK
jgi:hypothetical protein